MSEEQLKKDLIEAYQLIEKLAGILVQEIMDSDNLSLDTEYAEQLLDFQYDANEKINQKIDQLKGD